MKCFFVGGSGSGKTYVANKLSKKIGVESYDLDNVFWENSKNSYGIKKDVIQRNEELNEIIKNDNWIIEGVYYKWTEEVIRKADKVFLIKVSPFIYNYRIVLRSIKRRVGIEKTNKKETIKGFYNLIIWNREYNRKSYDEILDIYDEYKNKIVLVKNLKDVENHLGELI